MSFVNHMTREINCKIVYYGPGLCGKTTNLKYIYEKTNPDAKGKMITLATETERTLFFDFLPLSLGEIRGFKTRFHLYTVPGQVQYNATRRVVLAGADAIAQVCELISTCSPFDERRAELLHHRQHALAEGGALVGEGQHLRRPCRALRWCGESGRAAP